MEFKRLLAKSLPTVKSESNLTPEEQKEYQRSRKLISYTAHITTVMESARTLTDELGKTIIDQLGLNIDLKRFSKTVSLAAYLHDWGKASQHFQEMVFLKSIHSKSQEPRFIKYRKKLLAAQREHNQRQMLRHEVISGILVLEVASFREWLEECEDIESSDLMVAVWAAMGHHLKMGTDEYGRPADYCIAQIPDGTGDSLTIHTHHRDFQALLKMSRNKRFKLGLPHTLPELPKEKWSRRDLEEALASLQEKFDYFIQAQEEDWEFKKYTAAVKATVIAADLAGSALPNAGENVREWIEEQLGVLLCEDGSDIERLLAKSLNGKPLYAFQENIANAPYRVTLVKAGCGTGKTVGAYAWGQKWAKGRKLFFCYPTMGTASQGFIDYADGTDIEKALMHSRGDLDRELLCSGDSGDSEGIDARLAALQTWHRKLIICTVDTVLGLIQNNRRPLYAWCAIAQSAFVFDEVHAYDNRLFGALLQFLRTFRGAPILLMSASFTPQQLQAINEVMGDLGEEIADPISGPEELEVLKRYQIKYLAEVCDSKKLPEIWDEVLEALANQQKVLWVTNSVQSSIDFYREAKQKISQELPNKNIQVLIYHSRFRYKDRLEKHTSVINAFQEDAPVLAITTQVCEMSLDISADLLISAMAPAAALIQRMGRLNRRMKKQAEGTGLALIYPWNNQKPYDTEELETGIELIQKLPNLKAVSQQDLAQVSAELNSHQPSLVKSNWLEGNWCTYPGFLRKGGYTITVLLEEDEKEIWKIAQEKEQTLLKEGKKESRMKLFMKEAQKWSVPIRIVKGFQDWKRRKFYPIAPGDVIKYSAETGAEPCQQ